jgi:hypothetical protein
MAKLEKTYCSVVCLKCGEPIPVSAKVVSLQDEIAEGEMNAPYTFAHERILVSYCYFHENFTSELLAPVLMWQLGLPSRSGRLPDEAESWFIRTRRHDEGRQDESFQRQVP